jgi:hypothetical protein
MQKFSRCKRYTPLYSIPYPQALYDTELFDEIKSGDNNICYCRASISIRIRRSTYWFSNFSSWCRRRGQQEKIHCSNVGLEELPPLNDNNCNRYSLI